MLTIMAMVHTRMQFTPIWLVFEKHSISNHCHDAGREAVKKRKQDLIKKGNEHENRNNKKYIYK